LVEFTEAVFGGAAMASALLLKNIMAYVIGKT
jgi:hypothetical protein